jgi:hypothetical protein
MTVSPRREGVPVPPSAAAGSPPPRIGALRFADAARRLGGAARAAGLVVPAFRCPPRLPGARRTLRRYPGGVVVSVRLEDRPFDEVVGDMIEGVLAANRVTEADGPALRSVLRAEIEHSTVESGAASEAGTPAVARAA